MEENINIPNQNDETKYYKTQKKIAKKEPKLQNKIQTKKLRVLMLHGYLQNGDIFMKKSGAFRKIVQTQMDCIYVTSPNPVQESGKKVEPTDDQNEEEQKEGPMFMWWNADAADWWLIKHYFGATESIEFIKTVFRNQGPFDGILGFSQGAVLATILCSLRTEFPTEENPISFRFAILVGGFCPSADPYKDLLMNSKENMCPTVHCYGKNDPRVDPELSKKLVEYFPSAIVIEHDGGHYIPTNSAAKETFRSFLKHFLS